jgi:hypothetical protein
MTGKCEPSRALQADDFARRPDEGDAAVLDQWWAVVHQSPDRMGLIDLSGTIVAPRPNRPWRPGR